jgi:tight adherence protein B
VHDLQIDPTIAFDVLIFAAVFSVVQAAWNLSRVGAAKRVVNRRLVVAERGLALAEMVGELRKQRGLTESGDRLFDWTWLADLIVRSGVVFEPRRWTIAIAAVGFSGAFAVLVVLHSWLIALAAGVACATLGPVFYLKFKAGGRAKAISRQLPDALEVVVRSLEAGHPVPTAIALVGREMADPIGSEFGMAADEIAFGATLESAVGHIADRCRHSDVDLFAATIRLQDRSGGNLTGLLKMNAHTVRERQKMRMKIQAASSEGRISALILTAAPFVVMGILQISSPHFYGDVIHERVIHIGLAMLGGWMFLGNLMMRKMIDMRI